MDKIELIKSKIINHDQLNRWLIYWKLKGYKVVFTNGCFDLLHRGHIEYLAQAASLGDVLLVGLNTDRSVKKLKGENRPLQDEKARAIVLASLHMVTNVVLFDEDTPYELIKIIQPDILVKGSDYKAEEVVGYDIVKAKHGDVVTIKLTKGYSTSQIIERLISMK